MTISCFLNGWNLTRNLLQELIENFDLFTAITYANTFTAARSETEFQRLFDQKLLTLSHMIGHLPECQCLQLLHSYVSAVI
jgi:hypothetical protein